MRFMAVIYDSMLMIWMIDCLRFSYIAFIILSSKYVTLEHKSSLKSLGYICSNSQKYTVSVKIIDFFYAKNH